MSLTRGTHKPEEEGDANKRDQIVSDRRQRREEEEREMGRQCPPAQPTGAVSQAKLVADLLTRSRAEPL